MTMLTEELMTISRLLMFVSTYRWTYQWNWSTSKIFAVKTMFCFKYHPVHLFTLILLCSHVKYLFDRIQIDDFFIRVNWKRNHQMKSPKEKIILMWIGSHLQCVSPRHLSLELELLEQKHECVVRKKHLFYIFKKHILWHIFLDKQGTKKKLVTM